MRIFKYILTVLVIGSIFSCDTDDDGGETTPDAILVATSINFVKANGENIDSFTCVDAALEYAVRIEARFEGEDRPTAQRLDFDVNGQTFTVTFASTGLKVVPVTIRAGENTAQVSGTNIFSLPVYATLQNDFVLVP